MKLSMTLKIQKATKQFYSAIPVHWFNERPKIRICLSFCCTNEVESRKFLKKLNTFTRWRFNFFIMWQTCKMESIVKLKDKNTHPAHVIYQKKASVFQDKRTLAKQHATSRFVLMNIQMFINMQSELAN